MTGASQAINSLNETINSFKSRVDVKVNDVNVSTANIQATTNQIYANIEKFKTEMLHGEESQIAHENILRIDQIIKEQFSNHIAIRRTVMGVVSDFDINLVISAELLEKFTQTVLQIVLIAKLEYRLVNLLTKPDDGLAAEFVGPFARAYQPRSNDTGKFG